MIQIDMNKPKDCIWADITNHIYYCPLLNEYHKCNLQDYEPRTIEEQYVHCPLHEADPDTVSRQQAIDVAIKAVDEWDGGFNFTRASIIKKALNALPPSQTLSRQHGQWIFDENDYLTKCSECGCHPWFGVIPTVEEATKKLPHCPMCLARMESE